VNAGFGAVKGGFGTKEKVNRKWLMENSGSEMGDLELVFGRGDS